MARASELSTLALHGLRLKSMAAVETVADLFSLDTDEVAAALRDAEGSGHARYRDGRVSGWGLTSDGRAENERLLAAELDDAGLRDEVHAAYRRFLAENQKMLATCTRWQVREMDGEQVINDHTDEAYDADVITSLADLDDAVQPVVAELGDLLERFSIYAPRFDHALAQVRAGESSWFTSPMIESYHTVWFELHEDLLASLGIDRASEEAP